MSSVQLELAELEDLASNVRNLKRSATVLDGIVAARSAFIEKDSFVAKNDRKLLDSNCFVVLV